MTERINGKEVWRDPLVLNPDIDGGTIDNTTIGGSIPSPGSFSTLKSEALPCYDIYVDGGRTGTYTADGSILLPYKTVLAALTAINADTGKNWIVHVAPGTYSDDLTITNPRHLRIEGQGGVDISGAILINSGVGTYDRIEFVGTWGGRAEKGPAMTISGAITAERANDSLIYVGFHGCLVSGAFTATTSGTWVLQYSNCRVNGAITGTFSGTDPDESILVESYGFNEFVGAISGTVSLYNCNGSDFYCAVDTTPWYENRFSHCSFGSTVSIIPQVGASSALIYVDAVSHKSLQARTPTLTGATYSYTENSVAYTEFTAADEIIVGTGAGTHGLVTLAASQFLAKKATGSVTNATATEARAILSVEENAVSLSTVKSDTDIADAISKKHSNALDHTQGTDSLIVVYDSTDVTITLTLADMNKVLIIDNASPVNIILPSVAAEDIGDWISVHKLGVGNLTITSVDSDGIENSSTPGTVSNTTAAQTWANITLFLATATLWKFKNSPLGSWATA
jgi:hypothetical protein